MTAFFGITVGLLAGGAFPAAPAGAYPYECYESLEVFDPHGLVWDAGIDVDPSTLFDVEMLVDDYTSQIDDAIAAEIDGLPPTDGISSEDLVDDARWEVAGVVEIGRSFAGCEDY